MNSSTELFCSADCYNMSLQLNQWLSTLNYSATAIPLHKSKPLQISALFYLIKIISLDNTGILNSMGIIMLLWNDKHLKWNPSDYNNLTWFETRVSKVWTPTLTLLNPAGTPVNFQITKDAIWINSTGGLSGIINTQFIAACNVDLSEFPYDTQTCYLDFGIIEYWTSILNFQVNSSMVNLDFYLNSQDWDIQNTSLSARSVYFFDDFYPVLRVTLQLKRDSFYYVVSLVFPVVLLQLLLLLVFVLPQGSALRVTLAASLVLTMYVLQKDSAKLLPSFDGTKYPQIILGLCAGMGLGAVVLLNSVVSVILCQLDVRMPDCLWRAMMMPERRVSLASQSSNYRNQLDSLDEIKMRILKLKRSLDGEANLTELTNANEIQRKDPWLKYNPLIELKLDKLEEKRDVLLLEKEKKQNFKGWARLEFLVNFAFLLGYLAAALYYGFACLTNRK